MRYSGTLTQWNDERGFGWIEADGGGERLFVHISAFEPRPPAEQRPRPGLRLEFSVGMEQGRKRALQVAWRAGGPVPQA
ncbi:cold shock domain-containing protein, partial [Acinetobacter baumannii]